MNWTGTDTTYTGAGGQVKTVRNASIRNSMNLYANERGGQVVEFMTIPCMNKVGFQMV